MTEQEIRFAWMMLGCSIFNVIVWEIFYKKYSDKDEYWGKRLIMFLGSIILTPFVIAAPLMGGGGGDWGGGA